MVCKGCGIGGVEPGVRCTACDYLNVATDYRAKPEQRSMSLRQRQVELLGMKYPKKPPTVHQRMCELLAMRWPEIKRPQQYSAQPTGSRYGPDGYDRVRL